MATLEEISNSFYNYSYKKFSTELENSDNPEKKFFPSKSAFFDDFQTTLNAIYNKLKLDYPSQQANYIYKTLIANLHKQSKNPEQSKFVNFSKGTVNAENLTNYSKKVEETLKSRHPEEFKTNQEIEYLKSTDDKKVLDFNNPQEKKQFFDDLYKKLSECETPEEKINFVRETFHLSEKISDENVQKLSKALETTASILNQKEALAQTNPNLNDEELTNLAIQEYANIHNTDIENTKNIYTDTQNFINNFAELELTKLELANCKDLDKQDFLKNKIENLEITQKKIIETLNLSDKDIEEITNSYNKTHSQEKDDKISDSLTADENTLEDNDLSGLFTADENALEDNDLSGLFTIDENTLEDEVLSALFTADKNALKDNDLSDPLTADENVLKNIILTGADTKDFSSDNNLTQEDYSMEIEEKNSLWNTIKNGFLKIKDAISKVINQNRMPKELNGIKAIDTAENNTPSKLDDYVKVDISQEDQLSYSSSQLNSLTKAKTSCQIKTNKGDSLTLS